MLPVVAVADVGEGLVVVVVISSRLPVAGAGQLAMTLARRVASRPVGGQGLLLTQMLCHVSWTMSCNRSGERSMTGPGRCCLADWKAFLIAGDAWYTTSTTHHEVRSETVIEPPDCCSWRTHSCPQNCHVVHDGIESWSRQSCDCPIPHWNSLISHIPLDCVDKNPRVDMLMPTSPFWRVEIEVPIWLLY